MSWVIGGPVPGNSLPSQDSLPLRLTASTSLDYVRPCSCNGLCSLLSIADNVYELQLGKTLEGDATVEDVRAWLAAGCPLAKFLLSDTVGAGMETSAV